MEDRQSTRLSDEVVTRAYHVCELVRDVGSGVMPPERVLSGEAEADARAFIDAVDEADGPGSGKRPRHPAQLRPEESRSDHIERVVRHFAGPAFWQQVALAFPHVTRGDFGPEETFAIEGAMEKAIATWLMWNEPKQPTHDQMCALGRLANEASIGSFGVTMSVEAWMIDAKAPPSRAQAPRNLEGNELVIVVGCVDDENSETPFTPRTLVHLVDQAGNGVGFYEVQ